MKIINRVLESAKSIKVPIREPLNEVFFNKHPMLRTVEKIFAQWQTIARTQGYDAFKKTVESNTVLKKILMDLFGFDTIIFEVPLSLTDYNMGTNPMRYKYKLTQAGKELAAYIKDTEIRLSSEYHDKIKDFPDEYELMEVIKNQYPVPENFRSLSKEEKRAFNKKRKAYLDKMYELYIKQYELKEKRYGKKVDEFYRIYTDLVNQTYQRSKLMGVVPLDDKTSDTALNNSQYLIITRDGIKFNSDLIKVTARFGFYYAMFANKNENSKTITSSFLHEIGHHFATFLMIPDNYGSYQFLNTKEIETVKGSGRGEEMFADQFAAMYGYGYESIKASILKLSNDIKQKNIDADNYDKLYDGLKGDDGSFIHDQHPFSKVRINNLINQMKADLKDPYLDERKKQSLLATIKQTKKYLQQIKKNKPVVNKVLTDLAKLQAELDSKDYSKKAAAPRIINTNLMTFKQLQK